MPEAPLLPPEPAKDVLPEEIAAQIPKAIKEAQEMLEFAVADGLPVSDDVIEKIEDTLERIGSGQSLTSKDRTEFEKAYRDLAHALSPLTIAEVHRETACWWQKVGRYGGVFAVAFLVLIYPSLLIGNRMCSHWSVMMNCSTGKEWHLGLGLALLGAFVGLFFWRGVGLFTGAVTNRKLNRIILFCYVFTFLALSLSIFPFIGMGLFPGLPRVLTLSPINLLQGCAQAWSADGEQSEVPKEIRCPKPQVEKGQQSHQWIVNIGGKVIPEMGVYLEDWPEDPSIRALPNERYRDDRWQVQGGLVVPLYVIVLALMGSAVSMTRRVPEYQRDAFGLHETLSNARARENLVFQIMQVFSAPLVVMTAYYLFAPESRASTVLLGFASGFASEPILLAIRGLADKLKPASDEDSVSVFVSPASATLSPEESQIFTAVVRGSTNTAVTWSFEPTNLGSLAPSGLYTAPAPETVSKKQAITIIATSAADPSKIGRAVVNLLPKEESA